MTNTTRVSKTLSYILRHGAEKEGISLGHDGFARVSDLLKLKKLQGSNLEEIQVIVKNDAKSRFFLKCSEFGDWQIRANQGHSLESVEIEMLEIKDPSDVFIVIHGTNFAAWDLIKKKGLSRMTRQHIHFAVGRLGEDGVTSGMRRDCDVFIYIDSAKAMKDGIAFFRSANNVILSSGLEGTISTNYFKSVLDKSGANLLWSST